MMGVAGGKSQLRAALPAKCGRGDAAFRIALRDFLAIPARPRREPKRLNAAWE